LFSSASDDHEKITSGKSTCAEKNIDGSTIHTSSLFSKQFVHVEISIPRNVVEEIAPKALGKNEMVKTEAMSFGINRRIGLQGEHHSWDEQA